MGLTAGIVGLPNVGKSTIFNALTSGKAAVENYPFCTIDPNHGIVAVPDKRLTRINELIPADKVVPAYIEMVDIAGLVKGASNGEGLGNKFLGHIKDVDAIVHVVRCFEDSDIVHVEGAVDPLRDISIIDTELMLADLTTVEQAVTRIAKAAKNGDKESKDKLAVVELVRDALGRGVPARKAVVDAEPRRHLADLHLHSAKPVLYVGNVDEQSLEGENAHVKALADYAAKEGSGMVIICGKIEAEISQLDKAEQAEFLQSLGMTEPGLYRLTRSIYSLLGLQSFFTAGGVENRAWTMPAGSTAPKAAGVIHTDFEKGFIKADVYSLDDLETYKTEAAMRAAGKLRSEGKEYIVKDGDIVFFKFNV